MSLIIAGFEGNRNSAKIFVDKVSSTFEKMYLHNDKSKSVSQILDILDKTDYVFAIWKNPLIKYKICIELLGKQDNIEYQTNFQVNDLFNYFQENMQ